MKFYLVRSYNVMSGVVIVVLVAVMSGVVIVVLVARYADYCCVTNLTLGDA